MTYSEIENLVMSLYENGADIPVSALSIGEHGARYVHIEAHPKTALFWDSEFIPDTRNIRVSDVVNDSRWKPNYMDTHKLYEGNWEICNIEEFNKALLSFMDRFNGQLHALWNMLQQVNRDKLL